MSLVEFRPAARHISITDKLSRSNMTRTSSLIEVQNALLTYRVTPFSLSTKRPNCLWTSDDFLNGAKLEPDPVVLPGGLVAGEPWL